ncbi:MAG: dicarboxylate/amino acid:cation symporter [Lentisphaeria bacterium]|nr:dicarboxylate/amino acid:cation symporter [Lentisphaeria bacterium]
MTEKVRKNGFGTKRFIIWTAALVIGGALGVFTSKAAAAGINCQWVTDLINFVAAAYTRLFQFIAVPTIALAIMTTLAMLGAKKSTGRIFLHTIVYTILTTFAATLVGVALYKFFAPGNLPMELIRAGQSEVPQSLGKLTFYDHILSVIPNNILAPFSSGNVMSILLVAAAAGLALAALKDSENIQVLLKGILGLQELFFILIKALVWTLPLGIIAFAAQLAAQMSAGVIVGSLGKYVAVVLVGNVLQFFVVLPLFMLIRKVNPLKVFRGMIPAVLMALFTKSSAATLPVTIASAENNLNAKPEVARFILPVCCTINMNGCAAFILVTSLFVMQNGGTILTPGTMLLWALIAVISAVGNAGVPMGCYFLTLSLMSGIGAPIGILGVILPIYTIIDMIETAVNVWSDACICSVVDRELTAEDVAA